MAARNLRPPWVGGHHKGGPGARGAPRPCPSREVSGCTTLETTESPLASRLRAVGRRCGWGGRGAGRLPGGEHGGGDVVGWATLGDEGGGASLAGGVLGLVAVEHRVDDHPDVGWAPVMRVVACRPSRPGMRTSITTMSGWSCSAMVTAWSPSAASPMTGRPLSSSRPRSAARMALASSTINTRGGGVGSAAGLGCWCTARWYPARSSATGRSAARASVGSGWPVTATMTRSRPSSRVAMARLRSGGSRAASGWDSRGSPAASWHPGRGAGARFQPGDLVAGAPPGAAPEHDPLAVGAARAAHAAIHGPLGHP